MLRRTVECSGGLWNAGCSEDVKTGNEEKPQRNLAKVWMPHPTLTEEPVKLALIDHCPADGWPLPDPFV